MKNKTLKIQLFILSIVFKTILLQAQDYNTTIGLKVYPAFSTIYNQGVFEAYDIDFYNRFTFSKGLEFKQRLYKNSIYLESGLYLFERGHNSSDLQAGSIVFGRLDRHMTLPISLITKFNNFYCGIGSNLNYYLQTKTFHNGALAGKGRFTPHNHFLIGAQVYTGYEFKIANNILGSVDVFVSPTFTPKYINYGLGIAVKYAFLRGGMEDKGN